MEKISLSYVVVFLIFVFNNQNVKNRQKKILNTIKTD